MFVTCNRYDDFRTGGDGRRLRRRKMASPPTPAVAVRETKMADFYEKMKFF